MTAPDLCPECGAPMGEVEESSHVCGGWVCAACGYIDTHPWVCTCGAGVGKPGVEHSLDCPAWDSMDRGDDYDDWGDDYTDERPCDDGSHCSDCDDAGCPDNPMTWAGRER